jgi:ribosomal protein S18 acetylase RimI-like enzyme
MVVTATAQATPHTQGKIRPMDPGRDLKVVADLMAEAFADDLDQRGQAALREMRLTARLWPFVWWLARADPTFQDAFNGFVWEEPAAQGRKGLVVGNVSLNRSPGSRRRWIICNVVVHETYRGQGIGRQLTEAAIVEAQELGADEVLLQVHMDNQPAYKLYTDLGFREVAGETELRLDAIQSSVAILDAPGYTLRAWQPADGQATYDLARQAIPKALQWIRPIRGEQYRLDWLTRLGKRLSDLFAARRTYRLVAVKDDRLIALLMVTAAFREGDHQLVLLVRPDHTGHVEAALLSRALHLLLPAPPRPLRITVDKDHAAALKALRGYGFEKQRTLLTLQKTFRTGE